MQNDVFLVKIADNNFEFRRGSSSVIQLKENLSTMDGFDIIQHLCAAVDFGSQAENAAFADQEIINASTAFNESKTLKNIVALYQAFGTFCNVAEHSYMQNIDGSQIEKIVNIQTKQISISAEILNAAEVEVVLEQPEIHVEEIIADVPEVLQNLLQNNDWNNYQVQAVAIDRYRSFTGDNLVKAICHELGFVQQALNNIIKSKLEDEINAFDTNKNLATVAAIYVKLNTLSDQEIANCEIPQFAITLPEVLQNAQLAEQVRIASERERIERDRIAQEDRDRLLREQQLNFFKGENRVQVSNYIKAYNYCVTQHTLNAEAFINASFAEDGIATVDQTTEEQGVKLFAAISKLANGNRIEINSPVYNQLTQDEAVLMTGNFESMTTDTAARIDAIYALAGLAVEKINNIDDIFTVFNTKRAFFEASVKAKLGADNGNAEKLATVLQHFADKNGDKKVSREQQEMLKNKSVFMNFIGMIFSILPEFAQLGFIGDCAKRYQFTKSQNLIAPEAPVVVAL